MFRRILSQSRASIGESIYYTLAHIHYFSQWSELFLNGGDRGCYLLAEWVVLSAYLAELVNVVYTVPSLPRRVRSAVYDSLSARFTYKLVVNIIGCWGNPFSFVPCMYIQAELWLRCPRFHSWGFSHLIMSACAGISLTTRVLSTFSWLECHVSSIGIYSGVVFIIRGEILQTHSHVWVVVSGTLSLWHRRAIIWEIGKYIYLCYFIWYLLFFPGLSVCTLVSFRAL